jgi:hypothetical protein
VEVGSSYDAVLLSCFSVFHWLFLFHHGVHRALGLGGIALGYSRWTRFMILNDL